MNETYIEISMKFKQWLKKQQIVRTHNGVTPSEEQVLIEILGIQQDLI